MLPARYDVDDVKIRKSLAPFVGYNVNIIMAFYMS